MSRKKQETKVLCPGCGTEFAIADKEFAATGTVIGKNSDLGTVYPVVAGHNSPAGLPKGARERIEALRGAGVDVSCLFAMQGAEGGEYIASNKDGKLTILDDNDPIFGSINNSLGYSDVVWTWGDSKCDRIDARCTFF